MQDCLRYSPGLIADQLLSGANRRILLFGESGSGKSTLAAELAGVFAGAGLSCSCLGADPGSPAFGVPGAVCLGSWRNDGWRLSAIEALCTLDGGRFRLPLVAAVRRLAAGLPPGLLLVDPPGLVRGVAAAELLTGLAEAAAVDLVVVLSRDGPDRLPVASELATIGCEVICMQPSARARLPGKRQRARRRTMLWDAYLRDALPGIIEVHRPLLTGTPPPAGALQDFQGRQIALLKAGRTLAMGEILAVSSHGFQLRAAATPETPDQFLVRDACRNGQGLLTTFKPAGTAPPRSIPPDVASPWAGADRDSGLRPLVRLGEATAMLVNGVFGDPLLHLRLHNRRRSLLFDLGEGARLPARLAHQVTDVFISHAHIDHICGFLWLLRSRIGLTAVCRLFGPPGLAERIASLVNGIHWDRIGEGGPRFEVAELHEDRLLVYALQAGKDGKALRGSRPAPAGLLFADADCRVRAVALTHAGIPVLAYALELPPKLNVVKEQLQAAGLSPGPWLAELKNRLSAGDRRAMICLPDGSLATAGRLADSLIRVTPARRLVYATDLADSADNRAKLVEFACGARIFFCEAAFLAADREYARLSGHLTARACGEIASAARAEELVPFHFSRRYEREPRRLSEEAAAVAEMVRVTGRPPSAKE